ncbi:MAG: ABC transporter permease subunit [Phycisphaeraceae bacterium]
MLGQLLTIAGNTFTEAIRQPIFTVLVLLGAVALGLNLQLAAYTFEDDTKILIDLGLSTVFLVGLFLAAFTATGVLASEVESKTVLTVVSKPVSRPLFVVGKFLGVAGAIGVAFYVLSLIFTFTVRHGVMQIASQSADTPVITFTLVALLAAAVIAGAGNYLYQWVFTSTFIGTLACTQTLAALLLLVVGPTWQFQHPLMTLIHPAADPPLIEVIIGLVLVFQAVLILTAIAIAASTRLGQVMTLMVCIGAFLLGLVSNSFSAWVDLQLNVPRGTDVFDSLGAIFRADVSLGQQLLYLVAKLAYLVLPNLQFLWPADALTQGSTITLGHVGIVTVYALLYIGVVLGLAIALFQTREVG